MKTFNCPERYRNKPYGCGAGPFSATRAFLDYTEHCPRCGKEFKPYRMPRPNPIGTACAVRGPHGEVYCHARVVAGQYCARHAEESLCAPNQVQS